MRCIVRNGYWGFRGFFRVSTYFLEKSTGWFKRSSKDVG